MKTTLSLSAAQRVGGILMALAMAPVFAQSATVTLEAREVDLTYPAEAVVEAVHSATVAAQVQGRIVEVRADAGQWVRKGEVLMRIDAREFAENAAAAEAQSIQAKANFERMKNLYAQKFVSSAALDKAEADYKSAQAAAGASGASYSHANVTAPMSGIVAQRLTELGEMATPGKPLITVYEPKGLRVIASIPQYKLADVRKLRKARLEFPEAGLWLDAVRVEILPTADARSHTVTARLYLPDNVAGVFPGMAARAHFVTGSGKKLTVPAKAVLRRGEVTGVYVIDAQNVPRLRQVRLGEMLGNGELEVLAGLATGDKVSLTPVQSGIQLKQQGK
ncbi:MAG: efflux RND transporter periplasmic adaptor subunit [Rhodocyclales bacterium]|nr:efflux RND transporter periplasmic adaptor subunit [Rhodocyclales bacterium]